LCDYERDVALSLVTRNRVIHKINDGHGADDGHGDAVDGGDDDAV